jgi:dienelactone hydrolase
MTLIDTILMLMCGLTFVRWPMSFPLALAGVVAAAATTLVLEGWRTPLVPAYAVGVGLLIAALLPVERLPQWLQWAGLGGALLLLAVSIVGCVVLPLRSFPPSAGPYSVGTVTVPAELIERFSPKWAKPQARPAPLARLWYPTAPLPPQSWIGQQFFPRNRAPAAAGAAPSSVPAQFPIVIYFCGWPGTEIQNFVLIRELASRGFMVVSLIYPGKLPSMTDAEFAQHVAEYKAPWDYSSQAGAKRMSETFEDRVRRGAEDAAAMLDLLGAVNDRGALPQFRGRLDLDHAGVLGFSMGGGVAAQAGWLEPRFKAVVNLDGWHWHESLQQGVPRPYLYMSELLSMQAPGDLASSNIETRSAAERHQIEYINVPRNLERNGGTQVTLMGVTHLNFTDMNLRSPLRRLRQGGTIDRFRALDIVNAYVCSFFERELQGKTETLLDGDSNRFPEAKVKVWPRPVGASAAKSTPTGGSATPR